MEQFRKLQQRNVFQARLQKRNYYNTNTFQNFHFEFSIFVLYITI